MSTPADDRHPGLRARLEGALLPLEMVDPASDDRLPGERSLSSQRRRLGSRVDDTVGTLLLVETDGVLRWETARARAPRRRAGGVRRGVRRGGAAGELVAEFKFEELPASQVSSFLARLDGQLTPGHAAAPLRALQADGSWAPVAAPAAAGTVLLLVHGTFSRCDAMIEELASTPAGAKLLADARARYGQVLAYDHRTVGVSPMLNAIDLARRFEGSTAEVDVVCHSRGGLVSHWWARALPPGTARPRRLVCVASPLGGTSLAAPPRLRAALDLLANFGSALGGAAAAVPFLQASAGLMRLCAGALKAAAATPLVDATVAMIPGLAAQSREGANPELLGLLGCAPRPAPLVYAITSDFEPTAPGWRFWEWFRKDRLGDLAADHVFPGANDLVVDTASMTALTDDDRVPADRVLDFGANPDVHHCNYFVQPRTVARLREWLEVDTH